MARRATAHALNLKDSRRRCPRRSACGLSQRRARPQGRPRGRHRRRGSKWARRHHEPDPRPDRRQGLPRRDRAQHEAQRHADVRARLQHPLPHHHPARRRRCDAGRAQGFRATASARSSPKAAASPAWSRSEQDASGTALALALSYAKAIGCTRAGVLVTTIHRKRPRPTSSANRPCSAAAPAPLVKAGLRDSGRGGLPARTWPTSRCSTNSSSSST